MHKLYNTMQVVSISDMFLKGALGRFIINLHPPLNILNVNFTYIMVVDWIKFQFAPFPDNVIFPLPKRLQDLTEYAASPISLYVWHLLSIYLYVQFLYHEKQPNLKDLLLNQTYNSISYNLVWWFLIELVNDFFLS